MTGVVAEKLFSGVANILIVDDQPDNLLSLSAILDQEGFTVRQAINGRTALQTVRAIQPDLILLDIRMPGIDGYEVCTRLKADLTTRHIPIIFLSVLDETLDKARAFSIGGVDYITKPFQVEEVLIRIRHQLTIRAQQQQLLDLNQQLQWLTQNLEHQLQARTLELQQALTLERTLKRISDQVRDTLDQHQILRTVVQEVARSLEVSCCDAVLYSPDHLTSAIRYQYVQPGEWANQGQVLRMADMPEVYEQLSHKYWFAFCQIRPTPLRNHSAILACPIFDDQVEQSGILGDLWVFRSISSAFSEPEIHLLEQVANQCAIALRQARLYEAAQQQVRELEHLHHLKDDFLSTISHELRSPLANMKMALHLLDLLTQQGHHWIEHLSEPTSSGQKAAQYFELLKQECDRELQLVQDLLDLQHLEAGVIPVESATIQLQTWLPQVTEAFQPRIQHQQQTLTWDLQTVPPVTTNVHSLSRIVSELLQNACKYTPAHGTISIGLEQRENQIYLRVCNTGVEIAPGELARIFDKFYRIPNNDPWKHGGTGLGLALVQKLVENLGGSIMVTSRDQVTCFTVQFPHPTKDREFNKTA